MNVATAFQKRRADTTRKYSRMVGRTQVRPDLRAQTYPTKNTPHYRTIKWLNAFLWIFLTFGANLRSYILFATAKNYLP